MSAETARQIEQIRALPLGAGQVALWWLGQSGFLLRSGEYTVLIDAFLSTGHDRLEPPAFAPEAGRDLDVILCTHDHIDHLDPEALPGLAAASPRAPIVVPRPVVERVVELGIARERIIGAQPDEPLHFGQLTVHPVPACHGVNVSDAYSFGRELSDGLVRYLGYVFDCGGAVVYHAGDTLAYDGQVDLLRPLGINVALLPINGRDHFREEQNLVGNMDPRDATHLASAIGAQLLIPMHWDMFPTNLGYPDHAVHFAREHFSELSVLLPSRERVLIYTRPAG
jgi:L-ascorbate 6-phosphate lactonase